MKNKILILLAIILDLSVYGFVYYLGYNRGKTEADIIKTNIHLEFEKIAKKDK
jgi:hypothetical protein